jgi:hypothetical protein
MSRKRADRRLFYRRTFLNRRGFNAGAYLIAEVELRPGRDGTDVHASFDVADCNRLVSLDFYVSSHDGPRERANVVHKARLLRDTLIAFTEQLEGALEHCAPDDPTGD